MQFTDNQKTALLFLSLIRDAQRSEEWFNEACKSGVPSDFAESSRNGTLENLGAFLNDNG